MALRDCDIIITAARTFDTEVNNAEANRTWERLTIHEVHHVWYMRNGTQDMMKLQEEFEPENKGIVIHIRVRRLAHHCTIRARKQNGATPPLSGVFVQWGSKVA